MKTIETDRLILRPWTMDDAEDLFAYAKTDLVGPPAGWKPHESIDETREYLNMAIQQDETWAIVWKENGHAIGSVGLHHTNAESVRELGYVLNADYWNRGIMTEAAKAVIDFGFKELHLSAIRVYHAAENSRSKRVIKKCGFRYNGFTRLGFKWPDGNLSDSIGYSLTRDDWEGGRGEQRGFAFVQNRACEFFPCHRTNDPDHFNCLFCFCPLYRMENCGGNPVYLDNGIKDCSNCTVPHFCYDRVINRLTESERS